MATPFAIRHAAHQIRNGRVIAYPTDTVYGLGCDPMNLAAITCLNALKQRHGSKGLILIASRLDFFNGYIEEISKHDKEKILTATTPTSWVVPANENVPKWLVGPDNTLAIRITRHPVIKELCNQLHHPLVSSSANLSNKNPAMNSLQIHQYFHHRLHAILIADNKCNSTVSCIRVLNNNLILRP